MNNKQELSDCCNAPVKVDCSDDFKAGDSKLNLGCTCCYICTKCGKPCNIKDILTKEEKKIQKEAQKFVDDYFNVYVEKKYMREKVTRESWTGGEIGDVLMINGYFIDYSLIKEVLRLKPTAQELILYYDKSLELYEKGLEIVELKDFLKTYEKVEGDK